MDLYESVRLLLEGDNLLDKAQEFNDRFLARHTELHGSARIEHPFPNAFMQTDVGRSVLAADVYAEGKKIGELQFDLSLRPEGHGLKYPAPQSDHPLIAVMQHFYRDQKLNLGKGVMGSILDEWLTGIQALGVKHVMVVGGTEFWNKPAKAHPTFDWTGYKKV